MLKIIHGVNKIEDLKKIPEEYGVEIDIRKHNNELILNHEPSGEGDKLKDYLKEYKHKFIIFDIKEAGIEEEIIKLAKKHNIKDYFLLDVEFPFLYNATRNKKIRNIAVRFSEAEPIELSLAQKGLLDWVWIDTFSTLPIDKESYNKLVGFKLCLVCPSRLDRPEDIQKYKKYLKENNIRIDAVMTSLELVPEWEKKI